MLHHITWHQYFTAALLAAAIYYVFIVLRCYRPEIMRVISHLNGNKETGHLPEALQYQAGEHELAKGPEQHETNDTNYPGDEQHYITAYDHLSGELKACIAKAADKPFAPSVLIPQLKKILQIPREGIASTDRDNINSLVVNECERTGTALLTEDEVDQWWSS